MKKILLLLVILAYTSATFGVGIRSFYCCNKLRSTSISFSATAKKHCGMKMKKDACCKTSFKYYKVKDSHLASGKLASPDKPVTDLSFFSSSLPVVKPFVQPVVFSSLSNAPPDRRGLPLYILDCVYRI